MCRTWLSSQPLESESRSAPLALDTFRFDDEHDYEYEIWSKVFSRILKIYTPQKASFYHFSLERLALLSLVKEVTLYPDRKMLKLLTLDILFLPLRLSR